MLRKEFESSSTLTPEFAQFYRTFKSEFTKELKAIGATEIEFYGGHFNVTGFCTINEQIYYFSLSDVRGMEFCLNQWCAGQLMYRTVRHYKDWTSGANQWANIETGMAQKMFR